MGSVVTVVRYPLKSARGQELGSCEVEPQGLRADRTWACLDKADGTVGSAKHPRRWARLLEVTATVDEQDAAAATVVAVAGRRAAAGSAKGDALLSEHLGRPVGLTRVVPERPRLHRQLPDVPGMVPEWMTGAGPADEMLTDVSGAAPGGRFLDFGAVHLLTTGALRALSRQLGRSWVDPARFRPNLIVDAPRDPEPGQVLHIGEVVLRVTVPTPRCAVPGLCADGVTALDRDLLGALSRHHRADVATLGRAACFGVYAEVLRPGRLEVDENVQVGVRAQRP